MTGHERPDDATPDPGVASPSASSVDPGPAPEAAAVFGDRMDLATRFVEALATTGVSHGLVGPREIPRLWERHVLNCAVVQELVPQDAVVVDVGSGAGLPGLALAIARPDLRLDLVEPMQRRTDWLDSVVADLGLDGVRVHHGRAQDVVGTVMGAVATARAVTRIGTLAGWCGPLVEPGGTILAIKGRQVLAEMEKDRSAMRRAGVVSTEVVQCGADLDEPTTVARLVLGRDRPSRASAGAELRRGRAGKGRRR